VSRGGRRRVVGLVAALSWWVAACPAFAQSPSPIERTKTPITRSPARPVSQTAATSRGVWIALGMAGLGLGAILLLARRAGSHPAAGRLPATMFEVVGRQRLTASASVLLVRVGDRLLLLSAAGEQLTTLTAIDDPEQVARWMAACRTGSVPRPAASDRPGTIRPGAASPQPLPRRTAEREPAELVRPLLDHLPTGFAPPGPGVRVERVDAGLAVPRRTDR
jgi:flagellar biogenesis protein FliO